ncbi:glutamyl-tRNA(Gln) amidotransferase subunit A [bacterium MnTg02]|nr:glutamyl-tRNA(Gln) amidotransferase subunit A [bacterium MnTg02]
MNERELAYMTIAEIGPKLRDKQITSVSLTGMLLERIASHNDKLNAFITVTDDLALRQAKEADDEIEEGAYRGPLHGVPIAFKDLLATKGIRTTAGSKYYADWIPDEDATVVTLLREAGAVCLGKTGLDELAYGATSNNPYYGSVANPWKLDHHPGGSSGGSAAAVAAGLAFAAIGTDTGCSVRQPAQCCGIVGHKPTFGLVSKAGVVPLVWTMDHVGPLTRSVRDAAIVLQAMAGPDKADPYSARRDVEDYLAAIGASVTGLKLGVPRKYFFEGGDAEISQLVDSAVQIFRDLGAEIIETEVPDTEAAYGAIKATFAETAAAHGQAVSDRPERFSESLRSMIEGDAKRLVADYVSAQHMRQRFRRDVDDLMAGFDALLMPTSTVAAAPIAEQPANHPRERWKNCGIFNFTGQPAISIPCGFTHAGLPAGLMIAGRSFDDATVLKIAHAYEQATDWCQKKPGRFHA